MERKQKKNQAQQPEDQNTAPQNQAQETPNQEAAPQTNEANPQDEAASQIEALTQQVAHWTDKHLRLQAEFDNYRKRTARERMDLVLTAGEDVIKGLLPVLDDCERAIKTLKDLNRPENQEAIEGIELIYRKLFSNLESKGLKRIDALGQALDTDLHAAVALIPSPTPQDKGKVLDVVQQGYTLHSKVIRFANVVVGE